MLFVISRNIKSCFEHNFCFLEKGEKMVDYPSAKEDNQVVENLIERAKTARLEYVGVFLVEEEIITQTPSISLTKLMEEIEKHFAGKVWFRRKTLGLHYINSEFPETDTGQQLTWAESIRFRPFNIPYPSGKMEFGETPQFKYHDSWPDIFRLLVFYSSTNYIQASQIRVSFPGLGFLIIQKGQVTRNFS